MDKIVNETKKLKAVLQKREKRPWTIETYLVELHAETGTLADSIMIKEGYRTLRPNDTLDIEDDLSDILFLLINIALHYGIDLETAYLSMVRTTLEKLGKKK